MKRVVTSLVALGAALLVAPVAPASARLAETAQAPVTIRVEGSVRSSWNVTGVVVGDPLVMEYTFDPATPDVYKTDVFAVYPAVTSMTATVSNKYRLEASSGTISVADNVGGTSDQYRAQFTDLTEFPPIGPDLPDGPLDPDNSHSPVYQGGRLAPSEVFFQMSDEEQGAADGIVGLDLTSTPPDPALFGQYPPYFAVSFVDYECERNYGYRCPSGYFEANVHSVTLVGDTPPAPADADGDGVVDAIAGPASGAFDDGAGTTGRIVSSGTGTLVEDVAAPAGVRITTTGTATVQVCGGFTLNLSASSDVVITCGSVRVDVAAGTTTINLEPGNFVTVPAGADATVDQTTTGAYSITNNDATAVSITQAGVTSTVAGGATTYSKPQQRSDCLKEGWKKYGIYADQGRCTAAVSRR